MNAQAVVRAPAAGEHGLRPDLHALAELVSRRARVLDLGCGDGTLLEHLVRHYAVVGRGIELSEQGVLACVRRGLSVRQGNLEEGLADYPDGSFDYVILSQTLPYLDDPGFILQEMLRVGGCAIVSFSNWGYWRCRLTLLLGGRIPEAPGLPEPWYCKPRWQAFTVADFLRFCSSHDIHVRRQVYLHRGRRLAARLPSNLLASQALFVLEHVRP